MGCTAVCCGFYSKGHHFSTQLEHLSHPVQLIAVALYKDTKLILIFAGDKESNAAKN